MPIPSQLQRLALISVPILLLFAGVGWIRRPIDPLKVKQPVNGVVVANSVPKKETAQDQYYYASTRRHDLAAWEAVRVNFPTDKIFTPAALIELGIRHLAEGRPADALICFDQLVAYGEIERKSQTAGWAGQAAVMNQQGDFAGSQKLLLEKVADRLKVLPQRMMGLTEQIFHSNARNLPQMNDGAFRRSLEELPPRAKFTN
jgi:hypothetical protein